MKEKPYKAKSLSGAQREVRRQRKLIAEMQRILERFARERNLLARLSADTPQFSNPLEVYAAQKIRDGILGLPSSNGRTEPRGESRQ